MKAIKYIIMLIAGIFILQSCDLNELPTFDDKDAFVSFPKPALSIDENKESLSVPVILTSLAGLSGTVEFEIEADEKSPAIEGVNYRIKNESNVLTFSKEAPIQYIVFEVIDNDTFDGDVKLSISLKNPSAGFVMGFDKTCAVSIVDDEHPLQFILGTMKGSGESGYGGALNWELTFSKDTTDTYKIWISNLVPGGSSPKDRVYATVNEEKTEIRIPVKQIVATTSYPLVRLEGYYGYNGEEKIPDGGYISGTITEDGTITIHDDFGSCAYSDESGTTVAGWYEYVMGGAVIKKAE